MRYREHLNIILMRDNGPRRNYRVRRSRFFAVIVFFAVLPILCIALGLQAWQSYQENIVLQGQLLRLESDLQTALSTARRLENLAILLEEESSTREMVIRSLGTGSEVEGNDSEEQAVQAAAMSEGPGHEDFPALDTGYIQVRNIQVRLLRRNKLRLALDLHNTNNQAQATGTLHASLITADGHSYSLKIEPDNAKDFRINRFKRTVMLADLPTRRSMVNAQVIIEVHDKDDALVYRNIFAVEH